MKTTHRIYFKNSADMNELKDKSINLVVTSPPYPMVEIWDRLFSELNPKIEETLIDEEDGFDI